MSVFIHLKQPGGGLLSVRPEKILAIGAHPKDTAECVIHIEGANNPIRIRESRKDVEDAIIKATRRTL